MPEQLLGIGILRFEIGADIRIQHGRIVQHLLPIGILQPGVVVRDGDAVTGKGMRPPGRHGHAGRGLLVVDIGHVRSSQSEEAGPSTYGRGAGGLPYSAFDEVNLADTARVTSPFRRGGGKTRRYLWAYILPEIGD